MRGHIKNTILISLLKDVNVKKMMTAMAQEHAQYLAGAKEQIDRCRRFTMTMSMIRARLAHVAPT